MTVEELFLVPGQCILVLIWHYYININVNISVCVCSVCCITCPAECDHSDVQHELCTEMGLGSESGTRRRKQRYFHCTVSAVR